MAKFKVNENVMARWPGSNLWFEASVVDFNDIEYQVMFKDDAKSEYVLKYRDVKSVEQFQRSRSKSRGRSSSRGRSTGRRKSPGRKSPGRKSPGRPTQTRESVIETKPVKIVEPEPVPVVIKPRTPSPKPVVRLAMADKFAPRTSTPTRQSARIALMAEKHDEVDGQVNNIKPEVKTVTENKVATQTLGSRLCGLTSCVGGCLKSAACAIIPSLATVKALIASLLIVGLPFFCNELCTKRKCTILEFPNMPRKLEVYYDLRAVGIVAAFSLMQLLLCLIPIGRKVSLPNGAQIRCNGYISLVVTLSLIPLLMYLDYDVLIVYTLFRQIMATTIALAVLLAVALYIRARYIPDDAKNPVGNTGIFLADLFNGRETCPAIRSLDLKFFVLRIMATMWLMMNVIVVVKDLQIHLGQYSPTLLVACTLQIFYAVDFVWFEESILTTYEYTKNGFGLFFSVGSLQTPFFLTILTRLVLNHRTELEWYILSLVVALNLFGYTICRGSNSQKHAFRTNPSDPALAHLESLPTSAGTRLLVSGWWGVMRHPNYIGEILVMTSWTLLCGFNFALPWVLLGLDVLFLVARTYEVEEACRKKYGLAWNNYTDRVKYRLIPRVF
ncbi:delta(14)-sterol reductase TM7SF2-like [Penaeus monodon]|uniref:delta(14)-sterol reductase TM7SF2-like n=1 Tax=Penaeus monodon TaxID=6687 RepID=UPI0018A7499E|nr:delta(14)-sterol reductase TM7SF2-like [Penaeus monodon]XP_037801856.1 delta(14)-sterol reductase TM7SF2-like [Penaeus monodon]XP_037801857.1 delta(14)-sterol reductase TM7SF2-like [Penaeus monodon]XP_037801859.1 delta(14)-sterol reductase TM7SF2-like [Penaeus monodon]XP_037801860.1 delta(14)-sterol reductase TM7SF2-like [Penaeus monodon]XP_037801861.1 delta(14)-sterol reductase TM7SF2-like [Penaeus monodon]